MQLRELDSNDEAALFALEVQCFERPYSRKQVDDELNHPASLEIGYFDEFLVGAIALRLVHDEWWIFRIMVHPAFRRKAIASQLLEEAKKYGELWLEVSEKNEPALRLYAAHGFAIVGRRKGYYPSDQPGGAPEDAILMRREKTK